MPTIRSSAVVRERWTCERRAGAKLGRDRTGFSIEQLVHESGEDLVPLADRHRFRSTWNRGETVVRCTRSGRDATGR